MRRHLDLIRRGYVLKIFFFDRESGSKEKKIFFRDEMTSLISALICFVRVKRVFR